MVDAKEHDYSEDLDVPEQQKRLINLIISQSQIFKNILGFGTYKKRGRGFKGDQRDSDESDGEDDVEVGDGQMAPRSLFTFKALVLDKHGLETIALVMKVGSLRDCNIVLHLNIS